MRLIKTMVHRLAPFAILLLSALLPVVSTLPHGLPFDASVRNVRLLDGVSYSVDSANDGASETVDGGVNHIGKGEDQSSGKEMESSDKIELDNSNTSMVGNDEDHGENKQQIVPTTKEDAPKSNSVKPPVWPDDDDDDFVAKKNAETNALSAENSNNNDSQFDLASNVEKESNSGTEAVSNFGEKNDPSEAFALGGDKSETEASVSSSENDEENNSTGSSASNTNIDTDLMDTKEGTKDQSSFEDTNAETLTWDDMDKNSIETEEHGSPISTKEETSTWNEKQIDTGGTEEANNFELLNDEGTPSSDIAYHRNESNQEQDTVLNEDMGEAEVEHQSVQEETGGGEGGNDMETGAGEGGHYEDSGATDFDGSPAEGNTANEVVNPPSNVCEPATNCMDCLNLSITRLRSSPDPCYWVGQCISTAEASQLDNPPSGAYKCADDGSPIYTNESWEAALRAIDQSNQVVVPPEEKRGEIPNYYEGFEEEEESFFDTVKFYFNVALFAGCIAMVFVVRKRVLNRLRDDPTLVMAIVVKEEVVSVVTSIINFVKNATGGLGNRNNNGEYRPVTTNARSDSFEMQTVPLSTVADEEWGWDDEDTGPNLELPVGGDDSKEEEDLALAIAMSLSENATNGSTAGAGAQTAPKPAAVKPKVPSRQQRMDAKKSPLPKPKPKATISPAFQSTPPPPTQSDSIEDLLGQMNTGGAVITSLGQKPKKPVTKPKQAPKKEESATDDIFASMGFSNSYASSKPAAVTAPRSAPVAPSKLLAADNDDDADWGDDGDLDDLLDD